ASDRLASDWLAPDWFSVGERALQHWNISQPDPADERRLLILRKESGAGPLHRVMVIYPRKSSAYDTAMTAILADFAARRLNVEFVAVNYATDARRGAALQDEAKRDGVALLFAMGSETVDWMYQEHRDIAIPVVTVCAKDPVQLGQMPDYESSSGNSFAFTSLNPLLEVQIEYLRELKPQLKNIAILVDAKNASAVETQARPLAEALGRQGVTVLDVAVTDPLQARQQLAALVPQAVAEMRRTDPTLEHSLFWITGSTSVFAEIATITAQSDRVPVLSAVPEVVQAGRDSAVLSIGVSFESNARLAAVYAAEILGGRKAGEMKVGVVSPPDIAVNFRRAREIGLKIPFAFFEAASFIYDAEGRPVRADGQDMTAR
ncbi:MAG: ABC transporter substrate binding protein, partial [Ferrovibrio sp.]